jgi:glycosyltransferase involved in cell wall biosynthesis
LQSQLGDWHKGQRPARRNCSKGRSTTDMNILFVHNNFPAQFRHVARVLARRQDVAMAAIGSPTARPMSKIRLLKYGALSDSDVSATQPFARRFDLECRRAEQVLYNMTSLAASGFQPDVILAHPGWGETLPLKTFFPNARLLLYCEFFYAAHGQDVGFDPEFAECGLDGHVGLQLKNAATLLALSESERGISPTKWQRSTFPAMFRDKIDVIHEGVDIEVAKPEREAQFVLPIGKAVTRADEVVTFVARDLEPLRGYHVFMRALPRILEKRPRAQVVIIGAEGTSYGAPPPKGKTWKSVFLAEVADRIDTSRVHFVGRLPYDAYLKALQVSSAHVYLTYPFVLSWSLLEAMSVGCAIVASDTSPVREVIDGENGLLVPFFDVAGLSERVIEVLANRSRYESMCERARRCVIDNYDAERICVPKTLSIIFPPLRRNRLRQP